MVREESLTFFVCGVFVFLGYIITQPICEND